MSRYARQMTLPEVGAEGQARLARAHVLVAGAGGLGCAVLPGLAGAGVGTITVLDPDTVEESNLHRQPLYAMADLGRLKAEAAQDRLRAAAPDLRLAALPVALGPGNAPELVAKADVVVDAADSFAVSYILSDTCHAQGKPLIPASVLGQTAYAGGFCGGAPSLRAVFPDLPERTASCATAGVMGPVAGLAGSLQAQLALKVLLGHRPSPLGQLLTLDMAALALGGFRFDGAPEPDAPLPFIAAGSVSAADHVIELRSAEEAPRPAAAHATRINPADLAAADLPRQARIVLSCRTGLRAWHAARALQQRGFRNLALLAAEAAP